MINNATTVFSVVVEDSNYDLNFTLQDADGVVVPITGATLTFEAQLESNLAVKFSGTMVIINGAAGTCFYNVKSTDFPVAGVYNVQVVVQYPSTQKITFDNIQITANSRVPQ